MKRKQTKQAFLTLFLLCLLLVSAFGFLRLGVWQIKPASAAEIFSDGFDTSPNEGTFGAWSGTSGTVYANDTVIKNSGTYGANATGLATYYCYETIPAQSPVYCREYVRIETLPSGGSSLEFIQMYSGGLSTCSGMVVRPDGTDYWAVSFRDSEATSRSNVSTVAVLANTWYCVELKYVKNSAAGGAALYVDGVEVINSTGYTTNDVDVNSVRCGLLGAYPSTTVWWDDCVIADAYIGSIPSAGDSYSPIYRIFVNTTSTYRQNSSGVIDDSGASISVINNAILNATVAGSPRNIYVYNGTYLVAGSIAMKHNVTLVLQDTVNITETGTTTPIMTWGTMTYSCYNAWLVIEDTAVFKGKGDNSAGFQSYKVAGNTINDSIISYGELEVWNFGGSWLDVREAYNCTYQNINAHHWCLTYYWHGMYFDGMQDCQIINVTSNGEGANARCALLIGGSDRLVNNVNITGGLYENSWGDNGIYLGGWSQPVTNIRIENVTTYHNNYEHSGHSGIKIRPACNVTVINWTSIEDYNGMEMDTCYDTEGNGYLDGGSWYNNASGTITSPYNCGVILDVDDADENQSVCYNTFNIAVNNASKQAVILDNGYPKPPYYTEVSYNTIYLNSTGTLRQAINLDESTGSMAHNTFYLRSVEDGKDGYHPIDVENTTGSVYNNFYVYSLSGNVSSLASFMNGTGNNYVYYPYTGTGSEITVIVTSPTNTTYTTPTAPVQLSAYDGTIDTILWNCTFTNGTVAYANTAYTAPTSMTLGNGSYIFNAVANNTDGDTGYSTVTFTVAFKTTTMATTELINFYSMTSGEITTFLNLLDGQNITLFIVRLNAFSEWSSGTSSGISKAKAIVTAANALGIDVAVDLHTWYTTWDNYFDDSASGHDANRATYITYVQNVLTSFASSNVYAFMVLNEPQAQTASTSENNFILDVISAANTVTTKPISVRFMGGYSASTGHYSVSIDAACDFICRNTYWDARYPTVTVYGTSEAKLLAARDYAHANSKEFWITEFGKPYSNEETQRSYVEAFVSWANQKDVDAIFCWVSQPDASGESYNIFNGYTPRPAFYELVNEVEEEPPLGDNVVVLNQPNNLETFDYFTILFNYTATFHQGSIVNSSLWANLTGTWQRLGWNTTAITNATMHMISYTFAVETTYIWNIQVFNTTTAHWATSNRTFTIYTTPPADDPPTYGDYSVSNEMAGEEAIFMLPWWDDVSLVYGWLGHNSSGTWVNETVVPMFTPHLTFTDTITLNSTIGVVVSFRFYANDTADQENATAIYSLTMGYFMAWDSSPSGLSAYGTGFNLYFLEASSLAFQHIPVVYQAVGGTALFTVASGIWNGTNGQLSMYASSGSLYFEALHDASLSFSNVSEFRFTVNGELYSGGAVNILNGQSYTIEWASTGVVWLLPFTFIIGMVGLASSFAGPMYAIYKVKKGEYYEGMRMGVIITALGFALTIAWLWSV